MKKRKKYAFKQTAAQRLASYRKRVATRRANEAAARLKRPGKSVVKRMIEAEQVANALRGMSAPAVTYFPPTTAFHKSTEAAEDGPGIAPPFSHARRRIAEDLLGPDAEAEQRGYAPQAPGDGLVGGLSLHATLETLVDHYSVRDIMETLTSLVRGHLGTGPETTRAPQSGFESKR